MTRPDRILLVDDNRAIHEDYRSALEVKPVNHKAATTKAKLFGKTVPAADEENFERIPYHIDSAYQGQEALEMVKKALEEGQRYALAFVDIRMPPGWDGIETIKAIWAVDPEIEIVICSAHSDYSSEEIGSQLKASDNVLILKKPFDVIEIRQLATTLTRKWNLKNQVTAQISRLQTLTHQLERTLSLTKTTLEAIQEGILVLDRNGKIVMHNKVFLQLWNITDDALQSTNSDGIFVSMANQVEDNMFFMKVISDTIRQEIHTDYAKEWKLKSGLVLELNTAPHYMHGKVVGTVCSFRDVTVYKKLNEELLHQATHDSLTGLPNRILLNDRIKQAIQQAKRLKLKVGILIIDLDNFKQVNDSLGHKTGDLLLQEISKKLCSSLRESDTVTRLGGDEFAIVLSGQEQEESIARQAEEILAVLSAPCVIEDHELIITASIGGCVYPKDGKNAEILIRNADAALYYAKREGRNNFQFYLSEFNDQMMQQMDLTASLRQAVERDQLFLHYQPLVELSSDKIIGVEALLRWNHPSLGIIMPQTFIPLAEDTGIIVPIGEWVLRQACLQNKAWHEQGLTELIMSVNISVRQFQQKNFVDRVCAILTETGLKPVFLELEITESLILNNVTDATIKMQQLKDMGIRLAVDDFGTGYSSLSYLKYFSFDKIKIDKKFIDGMALNCTDNSIVEAIIEITKKFGIKVLAEGVEKEEQIEFLRNCRSDQVQGYYFSPPLDGNACSEILHKQMNASEMESNKAELEQDN